MTHKTTVFLYPFFYNYLILLRLMAGPDFAGGAIVAGSYGSEAAAVSSFIAQASTVAQIFLLSQ
jgi:hypothetical protein